MKLFIILFALCVCAYAQNTTSCTANVMEFTSTASCENGNWIVYGDLNIDNGKTLNVSFDQITLANGSLTLLGDASVLRYRVDLLNGRNGFINVTADANFGAGKLLVEFTTIPMGDWYVPLANFANNSAGFGSNNFTYPATELSCRQVATPAVDIVDLSDASRLRVRINITENESRRCICYPQNTTCTDYTLPNTQSYIDSLCGQMPNMPGCSLQSICQNNQNLQSSQHCSDISVLRTICADMPMMKGCADFNAMCAAGSTVTQCQTPIFTMPTTMGIEDAMSSICGSHHMDGCDKCPANYDCDLLMVYGEMCYVMPKMTECAAWSTMCADSEAKSWPMCDFSTPKTPMKSVLSTNHVSAVALSSVIAAAIAL